jgi:hypothetical protein
VYPLIEKTTADGAGSSVSVITATSTSWVTRRWERASSFVPLARLAAFHVKMLSGAGTPAALPGAGEVPRSVRLYPAWTLVARGPLWAQAGAWGTNGAAPAESCIPAEAGVTAEAGSLSAVGKTVPAFARVLRFSLASSRSLPVDESRRFPCLSRRSWPWRSCCGELESSWKSFPSWHRPLALGFLGSWCARVHTQTGSCSPWWCMWPGGELCKRHRSSRVTAS